MSPYSSAFWLSSPNVAAAEIAGQIGYDSVVLDIEHGTFDLATLERFIPFLRALNLRVIAKVLSPDRGPIQQALDFGASAVAIPHVENLAHAREVCAFGKFPPLGKRSFAGGRTANYGGVTDSWVTAQDTTTAVYPMIEDAGALEEIDQILALETVDGVFVGPSDLSLSSKRGAYTRMGGDFADLTVLADAARRAGKPWIFPSWSPEEKEFGVRNGADILVLNLEHGALYEGFANSFAEMTQLRESLLRVTRT
ncbi:HpcH/HpaI aldolase/citrate lyase family protein [Paeniglutamicibacter sp. MACA_103]|uniref:HpcH/HpaI aldolase family protein n=1 Tax=Paeniglutamicibacter sp. MACA_103 TaxID=3377337 RepID=UPI0038930625